MTIDLPQEVIDEIFPYLEMRQRQVQQSCDFHECLAKADYKDNHRARVKAAFEYDLCKKELAAFNFIVNALKSPLLNCGDMAAIMDGIEFENLFNIKVEQDRISKETAKKIYLAVIPLLIIKNKKYGDDPMTKAANELFEKKVKKIFEPFGIEVKL